MLLPRTLRKIIAVFRGSVSGPLIALSVLCGFWFGLMPGWSGLHVVLAVLVLVLNVHLGIFLLTAALGKAVCLAAAPLLYHVGTAVDSSAQWLLVTMGSLPIIGLTDYSRYALVGALILGPLVGLVLGVVLAGMVSAFRKGWMKMESGSDKLAQWQSRWWVKLLDRLLIGKSADVKAVLQQKTNPIRIPGVVVAVVLLVIVGAGAWIAQGRITGEDAAAALTKMNGAEVNLDAITVNLLGGRIEATGLQMTDPAHPERNHLAVEEIDADVSLLGLLSGKVVVSQLRTRNVQLDTPRQTPGKVVQPPPDDAVADDQTKQDQWQQLLAEAEPLTRYMEKGEQIQKLLEDVRQYVPAAKEQRPAPEPTAPADTGYLAYLNARAAHPPVPRVLIEQAVFENITLNAPQLGSSTVTCRNLSDAPYAAGRRIEVLIDSDQHDTQIRVAAHYDRPEGGATLEGQFAGVDLAAFQQEQLKDDNPVTFTGGTADGTVGGTLTRESVDLTLAVATHDMQINAAGKDVMGMKPDVAQKVLQVANNVTVDIRFFGPLDKPRLAIDTGDLQTQMKDALVEAGKQELANQAQLQLDKALSDMGDDNEDSSQAADTGKKLLGNLLNSSKSGDSTDQNDTGQTSGGTQNTDTEKKDDPLSAVKGLLGNDKQ